MTNKFTFVRALQVLILRGAGAGAAFFLSVFVTNIVTIEAAGVFLLSLTLINTFGQLLPLGANTALLKIVGANSDGGWSIINQCISFLLKLTTILGLTFFVSFLFASDYIALTFPKFKEIIELLALIIFGSFCFAIVHLLSAALQGKHKANTATFLQNTAVPLAFMIMITVAFVFFDKEYELNAKNLLVSYITSFVAIVLLACVIWFSDKNSRFVLSAKLPPQIRNSVPYLFVVMLMQLFANYSGQFATAFYLDVENVALFSVAQRTALLVGLILLVINLLVAPHFASAFKNNDLKGVNSLSLKSSKIILLVSFPIVLFILLFAEYILTLFGAEYIAAANLLRIIAIGQLFNVLTGSVGYLLSMTSHEKELRTSVVISGALSILLAFILTSFYGIYGAAISTAIGVATQNFLATWFVKKKLGFNTLNIFRKLS